MNHRYNAIRGNANNIIAELASIEKFHSETVERNINLIKIIATIKNLLERSLKQPNTLNDAVYESIDLARTVTPYTNNGKTVIDPPLTDEQKTLPLNKN